MNTITSGFCGALSPYQQAIVTAERLEPGLPVFTNVACWNLHGPLDLTAFQLAFADLVDRHDAFAMHLRSVNGALKPEFAASVTASVNSVKIAGETLDLQNKALEQAITNIALTPIDLTDNALWRARLFRHRTQHHVFCLSMHHLICDEKSFQIIGRDLHAFYQKHTRQMAPDLPEIGDFSGYLAGQKSRQTTARVTPSAPAWPMPQTTGLPADRATQTVRITKKIATRILAEIRKTAQASNVAPVTVWAASYQLLLARFCDQADPCISVSIPDRPTQAVQSIVGPMLHSFDLTSDITEHGQFNSLMAAAQSSLSDCKTSAPYTPNLSKATISYHDATDLDDFAGQDGRLRFEMRPPPQRPMSADLHLGIRHIDDGAEVVFEARKALFSHDLLETIADAYKRILHQITDDPNVALTRLSLCNEAETTRQALKILASEQTPTSRAEHLEHDPLVAIWAEILHPAVPTESSDFFGLGGTSLSAVRMITRVEKQFQCAVSMVEFLSDARLSTLRAQIDRALPNRSVAERSAQHLVKLSAGDDALPPLICLPGVTGDIAWADQLITNWGGKNTVYGLSFERQGDPDWFPNDLNALIDDFLTDLKTAFPDQPIDLAGFSLGGSLAHALAAGISRAGLRIGKVFILDTSSDFLNFAPLKDHDPTHILSHTRSLVLHHEYTPITADIHYVRCLRDFAFPTARMAADWQHLTHGQLFIYNLDTHHANAIHAPWIGRIEQIIRADKHSSVSPDKILPGTPNSSIYNTRLMARRAARIGDLTSAIELFEPLLASFEVAPEWLIVSLIRLYDRLDQPQKAHALVKDTPANAATPLIWYELSLILKDRKNQIACLTNLMTASGPRMVGGIKLVKTLWKNGQRKRARDLAAQIYASPPARSAGAMCQSFILNMQGDTAGAAEWALRAVQDPECAMRYFPTAAQQMINCGELDTARTIITLGLRLFPQSGRLLTVQKLLEDAENAKPVPIADAPAPVP